MSIYEYDPVVPSYAAWILYFQGIKGVVGPDVHYSLGWNIKWYTNLGPERYIIGSVLNSNAGHLHF
jgi:hypothetical protein